MIEIHQCSKITDELIGKVKHTKIKSPAAGKNPFRQVSILADIIVWHSLRRNHEKFTFNIGFVVYVSFSQILQIFFFFA